MVVVFFLLFVIVSFGFDGVIIKLDIIMRVLRVKLMKEDFFKMYVVYV